MRPCPLIGRLRTIWLVTSASSTQMQESLLVPECSPAAPKAVFSRSANAELQLQRRTAPFESELVIRDVGEALSKHPGGPESSCERLRHRQVRPPPPAATAAPLLPPPAAATLRCRHSAAAPFPSARRALQRLQDAALRGATAGLTLRGGLHLVSYVLHLLLRNKRKQRPAGDRPDALAMLKDTARWGAFLGSFSGAWLRDGQFSASSAWI